MLLIDAMKQNKTKQIYLNKKLKTVKKKKKIAKDTTCIYKNKLI